MAAAGETVRPADAAEAARIAWVIRSAFGEYRGILEPPSGALALDAAAVRDLMELGGILVCECDGRIAACVFHMSHPDHVYLGRLAVLPASRGRGLGKRLVAEVEALAVATGHGRVRLGVRLNLPRNREFFERLGYRQVGLDSHAGSTVPTFAWLEKRIDDRGPAGWSGRREPSSARTQDLSSRNDLTGFGRRLRLRRRRRAILIRNIDATEDKLQGERLASVTGRPAIQAGLP